MMTFSQLTAVTIQRTCWSLKLSLNCVTEVEETVRYFKSDQTCMLDYFLVPLRLTVEEHLWFYGRLKGVSPKDIKAEMARYVTLFL